MHARSTLGHAGASGREYSCPASPPSPDSLGARRAQPDPGDDQTEEQKHPAETGGFIHGWLHSSISARSLASDVTPTCRATIRPLLKISSAGIEEMSY